MLIPFADYRRQHTAGVLKSMSILGGLLLLGLVTKAEVTPMEWVLAVSAITGAVTYAAIRDVASQLAYALESPKFYREEADFAALARYTTGWRRRLADLVSPVYAAAVMTLLFALLSGLPYALWAEAPAWFWLCLGVLLLLVVYPVVFSRLVDFLAPTLVGWKEIRSHAAAPEAASPRSIPRLLRTIAAEDLAITSLISLALVLPLRHSPDFQPTLGYGSLAFIVAALVLVLMVLPLSLLSAWRPRRFACSGELYRHRGLDETLPAQVNPRTGRWQRWRRYSLVLCALTVVTCLALGALPVVAPIELTLMLLLLPVAPMFWRERCITLAESFHDAAELVRQYPARSLSPEQLLEATKI